MKQRRRSDVVEWDEIIDRAFALDDEVPGFYDVDDDEEQRALGGPGSGFHGHKGRPGQIGGSTSSSGSATGGAGVEKLTASLKERGFKVVAVADLPDYVIDNLTFSGESLPLSEAAAAGVEMALDDVKKYKPELYEGMKENMPITIGDYGTEATATTMSGQHFAMFINTNEKVQADILDKTLTGNTVATKRARDMKLTGDDFVREAYRGVVMHEVGHVIDGLSTGALSDMVAYEVAKSRRGPNFMKNLSNDISPYGAAAGPAEAGAEIFAAAVLGYPVASRFTAIRDAILEKGDQ